MISKCFSETYRTWSSYPSKLLKEIIIISYFGQYYFQNRQTFLSCLSWKPNTTSYKDDFSYLILGILDYNLLSVLLKYVLINMFNEVGAEIIIFDKHKKCFSCFDFLPLVLHLKYNVKPWWCLSEEWSKVFEWSLCYL